MKKLFGLLVIAALFTIAVQFTTSTTSSAGSMRVIKTKCVVKSTRQVVGHANDCGPNGNGCIDTTCGSGPIQ